VSLGFGGTLLSFGRVLFSIGYFFGAAFGGAAGSCTAVSFGYAALGFCYAALMLGFGEGHFAPSTVRAASQALRFETSNRRMPGSSMYGGAIPRRTYEPNVAGVMPR
jgi:hypothetical protein